MLGFEIGIRDQQDEAGKGIPDVEARGADADVLVGLEVR